MNEFDGRVITNRDANSQAAARSVQPHAANARRTVFTLIQQHPEGLACWEVEQITEGLHQSVSATINWLFNHGFIARRGKNRTPSGRLAHIYVATTASERRTLHVNAAPAKVYASGGHVADVRPGGAVLLAKAKHPCAACHAEVAVAPTLTPGWFAGRCANTPACRKAGDKGTQTFVDPA